MTERLTADVLIRTADTVTITGSDHRKLLAAVEENERLRAALDRIALSDNYWTHGDIVRLAEEAIK